MEHGYGDCFDEALIYVRGGSGGHGSNTFKFGKGRQHQRPFGGSGGDGGSVFLCGDGSMNTLQKFRVTKSFRAPNGMDGDIEYSNGKAGQDLQVNVPFGTVVVDNSSNITLGSIMSFEDQLLVARGGYGGKGNAAQGGGANIGCCPPQGGEKRWLRLELKLIADIGLIGVPNAGKSTLLDALTNARPKIAAYPFTTLVPNLGVCNVDFDKAMVLADIPGLVEGAHAGIGLGKGFLRHVERCKILIHVIDGSSEDPARDYSMINKELVMHAGSLASKPQIVVVNKLDIPGVRSLQASLRSLLCSIIPHSRLMFVSGKSGENLNDLILNTWKFLQRVMSS